ncbi:MAG: ABC transporter ATP-binding protein [Pseudomonadota bacterium]
MARLELSDLCFSVGALDILRSVDLTVEEGTCLALLGPSGCGKTTTLRCIAGFVQPTSGSITFNGDPVIGVPAHKRNVGLVFQDYALFPHMNVAENVAYGLKRRGVPKAERQKRVAEVLDLVQLHDLADRLPRQMSGGQQQRVALARALVIRPNVLLLDEPLGALDRKLRDQMQVELKRIQREAGITTIIVTHDQEEALSLSDHVAVMFDGRIHEVGTPTALYREPGSRAVMEFLGASNILDGTVTETGSDTSRIAIGDNLALSINEPLEKNRRVQLGIRPEQFVVETARPATEENVIGAVVTEVVYKGPHMELYVGAEGGPRLMVQRRIRGIAAMDSFAIGQRIYLTVEPDAILVF